ncbi:MAG TPA: lysophospholipid acyltransferase family protein [Pyrinomonadaceae bacterium]
MRGLSFSPTKSAIETLPPRALNLYLSLRGTAYYCLNRELRGRCDALLAGRLNIPADSRGYRLQALQLCQNLQRWSVPWAHSYWSKNSLTHEMIGEEHLRGALGRGRGVILLLSHFGPWPFLIHELKRRGTPINLTYPLNWPDNLQAGEESRTQFLRSARRVLADNGIVALMGDVGIVGVSGLGKMAELPFLGDRAGFPLGGASLAARTSSPLVPVFCLRRANGRHSIVCTPPISPDDYEGGKLERSTLMLGCYARRLEQMVRDYPQNAYYYLPFAA